MLPFFLSCQCEQVNGIELKWIEKKKPMKSATNKQANKNQPSQTDKQILLTVLLKYQNYHSLDFVMMNIIKSDH